MYRPGELPGWARRALAAASLLVGLVATAPAPQTAQAQGEVRVVGGTVVELANGRATLSTNTGPIAVQLSEDTRYEKLGRGSLSDLQPNQWVAVTGRPEGNGQVAVVIRVFPVLQATVPPRLNQPMTGPDEGNLMTNATIESFEGGRLTVRVAGQRLSIDTSADTQVFRPEPATAADVTEGGRIVAMGAIGGDGALQAVLVNVLPPPSGA
jgi:hypothetical protein